MSSNHRSVREIFWEAAEIVGLEARSAYLAGACGEDAALRHEIEQLLRAHDTAGGFLVAPADRPSAGATPGAGAEKAGDRIGRFHLLERIGEGGCGVVYRAEQLEPVRRPVALKIIKPGMDTRAVIARFELERQTLALMDHPHIARILDAGATELGRPYFAMELVQGQRITEFCDAQAPTPADRLRLFVQVCQAVQHAHLKGVIHRDLKPSNILVAVHDGIPAPKIIDFGIAKATGDIAPIDATAATRFGMMLGTPAYMSPEQAESGGRDIDTRADVYSLGVLLYELLTGCTPHDQRAMQASGADAVRRIIRDTEPLRPSSRLRALAPADLQAVALRRASPPPRLIGLIRGDLDWIVLKAMDKDRTRRYQTASELGHDVERFLQNEPIAARRPGLWYSFRKLIQRNRLAFGAAAAVGAALALGLGVATVLFFRERAARERAVSAEQSQFQLRKTADAAQRQARAEADFSRRQLIRLSVQSGNKLVDDGDFHGALLWFAEALRLETRPEDEAVHRRRFSATLRSAPELLQLWIHDAPVNLAAFAPDGRLVATAARRILQVWDSTTGHPVSASLLHSNDVSAALFLPRPDRLLTADAAGLVTVWDWVNHRPVAVHGPIVNQDEFDLAWNDDRSRISLCTARGVELLTAESGWTETRLALTNRVFGIQWGSDPDRILARTGPRTVQVFSLAAGRPVGGPIENPAPIGLYRWSQSAGRALIGAKRLLTAWNTSVQTAAWPFIQLESDIMSIDLSPDASLAVAAGWDGSVRLLDATTGQPAGDAMRHRVAVAKARFTADNRQLATASWDGTARVWSTRPFEPITPSLRHAGYALNIQFSPTSDRLVTTSPDQAARLWSLQTPAKPAAEWPTKLFATPPFSPDGRAFITVGTDRIARVWNVADGTERHRLRLEADISDARFAPAGRTVGAVDARGHLQIWDSDTGQPRFQPPVRLAGPGRRIRFTRDGQQIATVTANDWVEVWRVADGTATGTRLHLPAGLRLFNFSGDGNRILTVGQDQRVRLWDRAGRETAVLSHDAPLYYTEFSPDGSRVLTACSDRSQNAQSAQVWDAVTGARIGPALMHLDGILFATFSPDGRLVATGSEDKTAIVWDAATGERVTPPLLHGSYVLQVAFSPDSRLLTTCSSDDTARVWDVRTGAPVTPPLRHRGDVTFAAWSPGGERLATIQDNRQVQFWDLPVQTGSTQDLQRWAELLSAHRLDANGGFVPLTASELKDRWEQRGPRITAPR